MVGDHDRSSCTPSVDPPHEITLFIEQKLGQPVRCLWRPFVVWWLFVATNKLRDGVDASTTQERYAVHYHPLSQGLLQYNLTKTFDSYLYVETKNICKELELCGLGGDESRDQRIGRLGGAL